MQRKRLIVTGLVVLLCPLDADAKLEASKLKFDGFKLGDSYGDVMKRSPYDAPCDNDPIDNNARRFMVYGALPCRDRTFPGKTTVMFYLAFSKRDRYDQPIQAFAYLHGSYFNDKTSFPLKPGCKLGETKRHLGQAKRSLQIRRKRVTLTAHQFPGQIHVLADGQRVVGFAFGAMPDDPENEQWRGLMQMYQRYTPKQ